MGDIFLPVWVIEKMYFKCNKKQMAKISTEIYGLTNNVKKKEFYKIQAEAFKDYFNKFSDRELLSVYKEWSKSKDLHGVDKEKIWKIARKPNKKNTRIIKKDSEEFMRLSAVLEIVLQADMIHLNKLLEKREKKKSLDNS